MLQNYKLLLSINIKNNKGEIPVSTILTSASVHDSHAATYLLKMAVWKVTPLYTVMDAANDAHPIRTLWVERGIVFD